MQLFGTPAKVAVAAKAAPTVSQAVTEIPTPITTTPAPEAETEEVLNTDVLAATDPTQTLPELAVVETVATTSSSTPVVATAEPVISQTNVITVPLEHKAIPTLAE